MQEHGQQCTGLIDMTANALSGSTVILMLAAVQRYNLELSVKQAITWTYHKFEQGNGNAGAVIKTCVIAFPSLWYWLKQDDDHLQDDSRSHSHSAKDQLQGVNLSFASGCSMSSHFFGSPYHSNYSSSYNHLTPIRLSAYLVMTCFTP